MSYTKAKAEVVLFDNKDVITTSGTGDNQTSGGCCWRNCGIGGHINVGHHHGHHCPGRR